MTTLGLYTPGDSVLHRLPAAAKLAALVAAAALSLVASPSAAIAGLLAVLGLYVVAGMDRRTILDNLRPVLWFAVPLFAVQWWLDGWPRATQVAGTLAAVVLLAALVTLTTRVTELTDVVVRVAGPLRRVGVDPERLALLVSLGIRAVPVMVGLAQGVREAQLARGASAPHPASRHPHRRRPP